MNADSGAFLQGWALVFPVLLLGLWVLISVWASFLGGWHSLARRFRSFTPPYGEVKTAGPFFYSVYARYWSQYSSVIRLSATQDALYLSVLFPFRAGHPPLRIPWNEISFAQTTLLWNRYVVLTLGDEEQIPMRISQRMARNLGITDRFLADNAYIGR